MLKATVASWLPLWLARGAGGRVPRVPAAELRKATSALVSVLGKIDLGVSFVRDFQQATLRRLWADPEARVATLQLHAMSLRVLADADARQRLPDGELCRELQAAIGSVLRKLALERAVEPAHAGANAFLSVALRTHTLQATAAVLAAAVRLPSPGSELRLRSFDWQVLAAAMRLPQVVICGIRSLLEQAERATVKAAEAGARSGGDDDSGSMAASSAGQLMREAADAMQALARSCVLEHCTRAVMLPVTGGSGSGSGDRGGNGAGRKLHHAALLEASLLLSDFTSLEPHVSAIPHDVSEDDENDEGDDDGESTAEDLGQAGRPAAGPATAASAAAIISAARDILSGPCLQYAAASLLVSQTAAADGGTRYGLAEAHALPPQYVADSGQGPPTGRQAGTGRRTQPQQRLLHDICLTGPLHCFEWCLQLSPSVPLHAASPAALRQLCGRVLAVATRSAEAHAAARRLEDRAACQRRGQEQQQGQRQRQQHGLVPQPSDSEQPALLALLPEDQCATMVIRALFCGVVASRRARVQRGVGGGRGAAASGGPPAAGSSGRDTAAVQWWRVAMPALQMMVSRMEAGQSGVAFTSSLVDLGLEGDLGYGVEGPEDVEGVEDGSPAPSQGNHADATVAAGFRRVPLGPPPFLAAALSEGYIPLLERATRLVQRLKGESATEPLMALGLADGRHLMPLMAYGDPHQAAALVATVGKVARAGMQPLLLAAAPEGEGAGGRAAAQAAAMREGAGVWVLTLLGNVRAWVCWYAAELWWQGFTCAGGGDGSDGVAMGGSGGDGDGGADGCDDGGGDVNGIYAATIGRRHLTTGPPRQLLAMTVLAVRSWLPDAARLALALRPFQGNWDPAAAMQLQMQVGQEVALWLPQLLVALGMAEGRLPLNATVRPSMAAAASSEWRGADAGVFSGHASNSDAGIPDEAAAVSPPLPLRLQAAAAELRRLVLHELDAVAVMARLMRWHLQNDDKGEGRGGGDTCDASLPAWLGDALNGLGVQCPGEMAAAMQSGSLPCLRPGILERLLEWQAELDSSVGAAPEWPSGMGAVWQEGGVHYEAGATMLAGYLELMRRGGGGGVDEGSGGRHGFLRVCSNPACDNLAGDSEAQLEPGLRACSGCEAVWYCGPVCQRDHWRAGHAHECGRCCCRRSG